MAAISVDDAILLGMSSMRETDVTEGNEALDNDLNRAVRRIFGQNSCKRRDQVSNPLDPTTIILSREGGKYRAPMLVMGSWLYNSDKQGYDQECLMVDEET